MPGFTGIVALHHCSPRLSPQFVPADPTSFLYRGNPESSDVHDDAGDDAPNGFHDAADDAPNGFHDAPGRLHDGQASFDSAGAGSNAAADGSNDAPSSLDNAADGSNLIADGLDNYYTTSFVTSSAQGGEDMDESIIVLGYHTSIPEDTSTLMMSSPSPSVSYASSIEE